MSNTLILRSTKQLLAPLPGTPSIPDITSNIYWELDAASLSALSSNAPIDSWVATGDAPGVNRTYNFQYSGWGKPTFSPNGGPGGFSAVMFNGSQQIANGAGTVAQTEPMTYVMVCKTTVFANNQARIFSDTNHWVIPTPSGYSLNATGSSGTVLSSNSTTEWVVIVARFDGANSMFKIGTGPTITANFPVNNTGRNLIGGNGATLASAGLIGGVAFVRAYTRSLNASDIDALSLSISRKYGIV